MGRRSKRPDAIPRLIVRKRKSGTFYYYDHGGTPRYPEPLGKDYGAAIQKWAEHERTRSAQATAAAVITYRYVAEQYRVQVIPTKKPGTQKGNMRELAKLLEFFDDPPCPLEKIRPISVRQYMTWRVSQKPKINPKTGLPMKAIGDGRVRANREKALLSHIWNFARDRGYTDLPNPCAGIKRNTERPREVYVEDTELRTLAEVADQPLRDALDLAYLTGQRPADTLAMDERDVRDGVINVKQGKRGRKVRIEVIGELQPLLDRIAARKRGYVVRSTRLVVDETGQPLSKDQLRYRFDKAREATGLTFQFRDLRAKAGTDKAEATGNIRDAQEQLGHAKITQTEDYLRQRRGKKVTPTR